jgi:hypothetical protein
MSKVVTPPDIVDNKPTFLIVNIGLDDFEMAIQWVKLSKRIYTLHVYQDRMNNITWLNTAAKVSGVVLANQDGSNFQTIEALTNLSKKITWVGKDQPYNTVIEYFIKNG